MKAELTPSDDRSVMLTLIPENDLEEIAVQAWTSQAVTNGNGLDVMPSRYWIVQLTREERAWRTLSADEVAAVFDSMPGGKDGYLKTWGYLTFAKEIESRLRDMNERNR